MSQQVKAFLHTSGSENDEIRRFSIPYNVLSYYMYRYLFLKISKIFPSLQHGRFKLYWEDSDRDQVIFSTDEELLEALRIVNNNVLKIHVREISLLDSCNRVKAEPGLALEYDNGFAGNKCIAYPGY
ncbi:hypothetical protein CHS0354_034148 [Potamilus streckersoni]|uniref:PB1 domain-containing protein n=1 Tax=Potamilus streckersoni TaxID=2493646 RepID=A0AAE0T688_9BIVA|nr:hypothetical protein CHS0354_034148 [Potamilus streckersoni]